MEGTETSNRDVDRGNGEIFRVSPPHETQSDGSNLIALPSDSQIDLRVLVSGGGDLVPSQPSPSKKRTLHLGHGHQDAHSWSMQQLYNAPDPIALAPLRWNLVKIERTYEDRIRRTEAAVGEVEARLETKHQRSTNYLHRKLARDLEQAKAAVPLNGQIKKLRNSVVNLRRLGREEAAASVERRLPPLESKFWEEKFGGEGGYFQQARRAERRLREAQAVEKVKVRLTVRKDVVALRRQVQVQVKAQYRANEKSFEDPFSLHYAARFGDMERLQIFVRLWRDTTDGDDMVVRALAEQRDPDTGRTALHFAARGAQEGAAALLLDLGADPNSVDPQKMTPLMLAAGWGSTRVLGLLLLRGADKRMQDHRGRTAADLAHLNSRRSEVEFLDRWLDVGLTQAEIEARSALPPLPPLQHEAKAAGDTPLYLALRGLELKEGAHGRDSKKLAPSLGRLAALLRARGRGDAALACLQRQLAVLTNSDAHFVEATGQGKTSAHDGQPVGELSSERGMQSPSPTAPAAPAVSAEPEHEAASAVPVADNSIGVQERVVALNNLGELLFALGRLQEAQAALSEALRVAIMKQAMGGEEEEEVGAISRMNGGSSFRGEDSQQRRRANSPAAVGAAMQFHDGSRGLVATAAGSGHATAELKPRPCHPEEPSPQNGSYGRRSGSPHLSSGDPKGASELEAAARSLPAAGPAIRNLGVCLFAQGLFAEAEAYLVVHLSLERERHVNQGVGAVSESPHLVPSIEVVAMTFALQQTGLHNKLKKTGEKKKSLSGRHGGVVDETACEEEAERKGRESRLLEVIPDLHRLHSSNCDSFTTADSSESGSVIMGAEGDEIHFRQRQQTHEERLDAQNASKRVKALALFDQAMAIGVREFGRDTPQVARQLEHIGLAHFLGGDFAMAERHFRDAHDTLLRSSGKAIIRAGGGGRAPRASDPDGNTHPKDYDDEHPLVGRFDPTIMRICYNMAIAQCCRGPSVF